MELHPVDISDYRTLTSSLRGILISRNRKGIRKVLPKKKLCDVAHVTEHAQ